jgi:hypothetical protein
VPQSGFKKCPFCGEDIREVAIKCRFCGEFLKKNEADNLFKSDKANQVHHGHAIGTDTEVFFEGNISRIALIGPTVILIFGITISIIVSIVGGQLIRNSQFEMIPVISGGMYFCNCFIILVFQLARSQEQGISNHE